MFLFVEVFTSHVTTTNRTLLLLTVTLRMSKSEKREQQNPHTIVRHVSVTLIDQKPDQPMRYSEEEPTTEERRAPCACYSYSRRRTVVSSRKSVSDSILFLTTDVP